MTDDITSSQVSGAEYTTRVQLEIFPFLGVCVFGPRFYYNKFLVNNRTIGWLIINEALEI